jgi:site-specific DNA-methyltransferase (adenine-specific)
MDNKTIKAMMKTGNGEQSTPQWLFDFLDKIFDFKIDVCATKKNKKCKKFYSRLKSNSFKKKWGPGNCFCNPPYGNPQNPCRNDCNKITCENRGFHLEEYWPGIVDWAKRAKKQAKKFNNKNNIVLLVPARTETEWFQIIWKYADVICFVKGRLCFNNQKNVAPFPSVIAIFGKPLKKSKLKELSKIGAVIVNKEKELIKK